MDGGKFSYDAGRDSFSKWLNRCVSASIRRRPFSVSGLVLTTHTSVAYLRYLCGQYGKKLNPHHIGRSDTGDMAVCALGSRHHLSKWLIRRGLMAECKETPIIRTAKAFAVFDHHIEAVEGAREISSARS